MTTAQTIRNPRSPVAMALGLIPYCLLLVGAYLVFGHSPDDAYITYRYAAHFAAGHGPVFNITERVEGFSSPLHMVLSALLLMIAPSVDIFFKGKLLGVAFGLGTLALLGRAAKQCGLNDSGALTAQILLALNINFAMASVNGLETTLYAFLVVASVSQFLSERQTDGTGWRGFGSGFLLFLAMLARPDAILLFAAFLFVRVIWSGRNRADWMAAGRWAAAFLIPTAILVLARWAYFGYPLPNTFYAKSVGIEYGIQKGFPYLWHGLIPFSRWMDEWGSLKAVLTLHGNLIQYLLVLSALLFWGVAILGFFRVSRTIGGQVCAAVILALTFFVLRTGGDWMSGWRFMIATLPFFAILQIHGLNVVADFLLQRRETRAIAVYAVAACVWAVCLLCAPHITWAKSGFSTSGAALMRSDEEQNGPFEVAIGDFIRDRLPTCKRIAYSEMGYATFTNRDKEFLDTGGLTNVALAHAARQYKGRTGFKDPNWRRPESPLYKVLKETRPDAIIVVALLSPDQTTDPVLGDYRPIPPVGVTPTLKFGDRAARIYLAPGVAVSGGPTP